MQKQQYEMQIKMQKEMEKYAAAMPQAPMSMAAPMTTMAALVGIPRPWRTSRTN